MFNLIAPSLSFSLNGKKLWLHYSYDMLFSSSKCKSLQTTNTNIIIILYIIALQFITLGVDRKLFVYSFIIIILYPYNLISFGKKTITEWIIIILGKLYGQLWCKQLSYECWNTSRYFWSIGTLTKSSCLDAFPYSIGCHYTHLVDRSFLFLAERETERVTCTLYPPVSKKCILFFTLPLCYYIYNMYATCVMQRTRGLFFFPRDNICCNWFTQRFIVITKI